VAALRCTSHRYGFEAYIKDPQMFVPYPDDNYLFFRASTEKTIEGIRRFSPHDAEAYPKFLEFFERASAILNPILLEEPPSIADLAGRFRGEDEEIYGYLMFGNLYDMLADYFESDYLRAAFAGQGVIGSFIGPKTPGSVYVVFHASKRDRMKEGPFADERRLRILKKLTMGSYTLQEVADRYMK
jgi:phytoene dehydrogenase-like protein